METIEVTITDVTDEDIVELAENMRDADIAEVWRTSMSKPEKAIRRAVSMSQDAWVARCNGDLICIFGVASIGVITKTGSPWLLATDNILKYPFHFLDKSRYYIAEMASNFDRLVNHVDADNKVSIRWLRWLGFDVSKKPKPYGIFEMPFYEFEMRH